ncbi:PTS system protein [Klebsiella pneumoniae]|uniref:PTS system protein n=1 Tax=Klebsiella pneumoniae TaxID=573 RepID=A0A2X1SDK9_KLEPN|nr:PTS system protein [Klebsiella pneumoniae]
MTRLRFVVKDDEQVDSSTLKGLAGVLGVVRSDNQCQVIIGNTVSQAYREVVNLLPGDLRPAEPQGKAPLTLKRIGAGILDALIGTMSPLIPAIIGGSMVKLLAMILEMSGALPKGSPTLTLLALIGDGAFFFLPLMVAASTAVKFKTNMSLAIAIAGVLVHPGFIELMAKAAQGEHVEFAFIPVTAVKYTYTVIPALVMTWCLSYIERWVDRITPAVTKKLSEADADRANRRPAGDPADWPAGHLDRQRHFRAGVYDPQLSRLAVGGDHGRAVAAVGDDRYAPRLYGRPSFRPSPKPAKRVW